MARRTALYCQASTDDQSCERQEQDLVRYANGAGYQVVAVFKETASGAKNDRPERKKALDLAQSGEVDVILVTELPRWGRSTQDLLETLQQLQTRNVSLIALTGIEFDLSTPTGKLIATFMSGLAEFECDLISDQVKSGATTVPKSVALVQSYGSLSAFLIEVGSELKEYYNKQLDGETNEAKRILLLKARLLAEEMINLSR
jgi:DNA invertase Pin-like site-specific DNA recombinase